MILLIINPLQLSLLHLGGHACTCMRLCENNVNRAHKNINNQLPLR